MRTKLIGWLMTGLAAVAPVVVLAQQEAVIDTDLARASDPQRDVLPRAGAYYSQASSGTGLLIEVGRDGLVFGAFFYHRAPGDRDWVVLNGQFAPSDFATWAMTGETGRLVAAFNETTMPANGSVGFNASGGAPASTTATQQPPIELVWFGPERVRVRWNGTEQVLAPLTAIDPAGPLDQRLVGEWRVTGLMVRRTGYRNTSTGATRWGNPEAMEYMTGDVSISATSAPAHGLWESPAGAAPLDLPAAGASWFLMKAQGARIKRFTGSSASHPAYELVTNYPVRMLGLIDSGAGAFIHFNGATGLHESLWYSTLAADTRVVNGQTQYRVKSDAVASRFYFLSSDRVVVRVFRFKTTSDLELWGEYVLDRKTEGVTTQKAAGCERKEWQDGGLGGWQNCGDNGIWP